MRAIATRARYDNARIQSAAHFAAPRSELRSRMSALLRYGRREQRNERREPGCVVMMCHDVFLAVTSPHSCRHLSPDPQHTPRAPPETPRPTRGVGRLASSSRARGPPYFSRAAAPAPRTTINRPPSDRAAARSPTPLNPAPRAVHGARDWTPKPSHQKNASFCCVEPRRRRRPPARGSQMMDVSPASRSRAHLAASRRFLRCGQSTR